MGADRSTVDRSLAATGLIGRQAELTRVLDTVDEGWNRPRTLLLLGEAGAGKSRLLSIAADHARDRGALVLAAQGAEAESRHSFASLHLLLLPVLSDLGGLPDHLRNALEAAFGMAPAQGPVDPMPLRMAVLTLLTDIARGQRLLIAVDDVQHVDRDSLDVLDFVVRRITARGVPVLLAARGLTPPDGVPADAPALPLDPLPPQAAAELLDAQPHPPTGRTRMEVLRQAEGNPLAVIELCRAARADGAGVLHGGGRPRTERLQELYAARLRSLPETTRRLVLHAAASEHEDIATVMAAAGTGTDLAAWAPAEEAGLLTLVDGRVAFRHPLVRAAAYHGAPAHLRQRAHRDLACALTTDPARRAWHLAAACLGEDEAVAAALEDTAELAERRGGFFAAGQALQRSAECSPRAQDRARRYAKALRAANNAGDPGWVRELYDKVSGLTDDRDVLGMVAQGAGMALSLLGHQRQGFQVLMSALEPEPPKDPMTVLALTAMLHAVAFQSGLPEVRRPLAALVEAIGPDGGDTTYTELAMTSTADRVRAGTLAGADPTRAPELLRQQLDRWPTASGPTAQVGDMILVLALGGLAWYADESDLCVESYQRAYAVLTAYGSVGPTRVSRAALASALMDTGRWTQAEEQLEEAATLAAVHKLRHLEIDIAALRVTLDALRGLPAEVPADPAWTAVPLAENRATHARLLRAAGAAAAAQGDFEASFRHMRSLFTEDGTPLHHFLSPRSVADLAAAAQRTGRQQEAARIVEAVRTAVGPRPTARMRLLLHHADALVGDPLEAEHHFRLATVDPAGEQWPLARAQARLHYAQWLRRKRRPLDARPLLAMALETFTRLGAARLAQEARVELRASGAPTGPAQAGPLAELTAQQRQIVRLAAQGLRNKEIAEQLMISPRTVSSHLYQVYPKLGVSNRNQLSGLFQDL
ncbi:helix-turn-helix transcriptional regulator [Streptomyces antimicrobicus]|uniref:LuxR C-terminal-related transcriptional regulator n=1 Tax=Streptomyces antimicrobicus TaxID=2883108 RepID=A0ABS8B462_9ACTN|nr:helix-turn-helix transcriptional regulator [Streptomyces antimicrobicus]MCB5179400.1 LuxR C-terminal-related transcriptional regulator [Streptomyces antimicrobicus]